jgi:2,3-dihydroxybiphenyl 1,2-dioxygenase
VTTCRVHQLGYIGLEVSDIGGWEEFATRVLGLELAGKERDGALLLRMDENHHRIAVHEGPLDDIAFVGWEVPDERALSEMAEHLRSLGCQVAVATEAEAEARRVKGLVNLRDPSGVLTELYHGPWVDSDRPFRSPRPIQGFEAGSLGLGHIVLSVDDYAASMRFYRDGLGLLISDFIEFDVGEDPPITAAFLHSGPRHHSLALMEVPAPKRLHHLMLELVDMDDVGSTYDLCIDEHVPIVSTLGRHTNDRMTSFYMESPSGFQVEYGHGGRVIDDSAWTVEVHHSASIWGHRSPTPTSSG